MRAEYNQFQHLWGIGCVRVPAGALPYPISWRDIEADTRWTQHLLRGMGIAPGALVHLSHYYSELAQLWPFYQATRDLGAVIANGMPSPFDAYRLEMYLRRFRLTAAIGIAPDTLNSLEQQGHDLQKLFASTAVLAALPGAWERLRVLGFKPWRLIALGPLLAIEAPDASGARFNNREWQVTGGGDGLRVSAGPQRACDFRELETGVAGMVEKVEGAAGPEFRLFV